MHGFQPSKTSLSGDFCVFAGTLSVLELSYDPLLAKYSRRNGTDLLDTR